MLIMSFLIHEQGVSRCSLISAMSVIFNVSVTFVNILQIFQVDAQVLPIFFDFMNGIVIISNHSFLAYKNKINFYILFLYNATFQNSLISFSSFPTWTIIVQQIKTLLLFFLFKLVTFISFNCLNSTGENSGEENLHC